MALNKCTSRAWWTRITDHIILGALPLRNRNHHLQLQAEGVVAVVTMNQPYELEKTMLGVPVAPGKYLKGRRIEEYFITGDWKALGIDQCFGTTNDFCPPTLDILIRCVEFTKQHIDQGGTVYIHCKAGRGRSTIVVAAYLMQANRWTVDEALDFIQSKRHHISRQRRMLDEFARHLNDSSNRA
ncbi:Aste57867_2388 [Aphanomyces stellatus]|uniref:Aste57867_2388 protein n=1 Tax=Aphanomyces stellatus TaxID=120398 RepID=A0A485KD45_9STRA|nr:hypothetical protein As57867_002382 [Aphanomyces stellatus]VFT79589.1 Aste57867_2388 [Aphanomyces stellatus]